MVDRIPRLHQRVVPSLGRLAPPEWQDDPDFDIDYHMRHVALPAPGSRRQLFDLATLLVRDPFDRTRPLWEFVVVEGLEGDRAALVQKMHHTITDGEGGIRMSEQFIDVERDAPDIDEIALTLEPPSPDANIFETAGDTIGHTWRRTLGLAQRAGAAAASTAAHPERLGRVGPDLVETARSAIRQLTVTDRSHSPLWTDRSLRRRLDVLDVDLDDARAAAKTFGGSLNDFFVTGAAGGAGAYHQRAGRARRNAAHGHAGEHPQGQVGRRQRLRAHPSRGAGRWHSRRAVRDDPRPARPDETRTGARPRRSARRRAQPAARPRCSPDSRSSKPRTVDFTTSNVRAAPFDLFIAGALIEATYPLGPLGSTAFNLTMMSYRGELNMGLHMDTGAIHEPDLLRGCLEEAYAELIAAAR